MNVTAKRGDLILADLSVIGSRPTGAGRYRLALAVKCDGSGKVSWARTDAGSFPVGNVYTLRSLRSRHDLAGMEFPDLASAKAYLTPLLGESPHA